MAKIKPFRAIIYNQEKITDLSRVVCPPYDIITIEKQQYYHDLSPYNFIHILLGKDILGEDKYRRASRIFNDWLKNKIFIQDEDPAIYFYSQQYNLKGEKKNRVGFIALLHLEDKDSTVFGHEHTHLEPKADRLRLLRQIKANLSPIFVLTVDKKRIIQTTWQQIQRRTPFIDITDDEKIIHRLWRLNSPDFLDKIQTKMQDENIFIADGHHRYEVACAYRDQMRQKLRDRFSGEEDFNYVLAYFTNIDSKGLTILPVHRLVKLNPIHKLDNLKSALQNYFEVEEIKDKERFFFLMEKAGMQGDEHLLGMYKDKKYWFLRLKNVKILDKMIADKPPEFRSLDISILNYIILKNILGLDLDDKESITSSHNTFELIERVDNDTSCIAFFLNPLKIQEILSVALRGEKLPSKSTYFYPKVLSGFLINKHGTIW